MKKANQNKNTNKANNGTRVVASIAQRVQQPAGEQATAEESTEDDDLALAFASVEAEVRAVDKSMLLRHNLDAPSVVTMIIGALPEITALAGEATPGGRLDGEQISKLRAYALALAYTHTLYRTAVTPRAYAELVAQLTRLRAIWISELRLLVQRGALDPEYVERLRPSRGHKGLVFDVAGYVQLFRQHWTTLEGHTSLQQSEIDQAGKLVSELITALGAREQTDPNSTEAGLLRAQAFTLCINAYDEVRRAIAYLRWHEGDLERIAPSLYTRRGRRRPEQEAEPEVVNPPPLTATPAAPAAVVPPAVTPAAVNASGGTGTAAT